MLKYLNVRTNWCVSFLPQHCRLYHRHERFHCSWKVTFYEITCSSRGCILQNLCILMICVFRLILAASCHFQKSIWDTGTKQTHKNVRMTELAQLPDGISLRKQKSSFILLAKNDRKMMILLLKNAPTLLSHSDKIKCMTKFLCHYPHCGSPPKHGSLHLTHMHKFYWWSMKGWVWNEHRLCGKGYAANSCLQCELEAMSWRWLHCLNNKIDRRDWKHRVYPDFSLKLLMSTFALSLSTLWCETFWWHCLHRISLCNNRQKIICSWNWEMAPWENLARELL